MTAPTSISSLSYTDLQGRTVYGSDGSKIGKIADLYDDDSGGAPVLATVHTGLFGSKTTFVPLTQAELRGDDVAVPYSKDVIKGAPGIEADAEISGAEEQEILAYYGMAGSSQGRQADGHAAAGIGHDPATGHESVGHDTSGHDTSGPNTDNAMTRSEEQLRVGTQAVEAGRARLRKYVVTENVTQTIPVSHEEVRVEREPITEANAQSAQDGPLISEEEHEVVLHAEQPVVQKEAVPVERVRLGTETVREEQTVSEEVRKEQIETDDGSRTR
jgi:uncharacterized protein (TIGR02271 family)